MNTSRSFSLLLIPFALVFSLEVIHIVHRKRRQLRPAGFLNMIFEFRSNFSRFSKDRSKTSAGSPR